MYRTRFEETIGDVQSLLMADLPDTYGGLWVELNVGNPGLFLADLAEAGIELPDSVIVLAKDPEGEPPDTNQGVLLAAITPDDRVIYLPVQPPSGDSMMALLEGTLVEVDGCPGPYWVAAPLETLVEQSVPDIYFEPFSSGDQILAWFANQSRPSPETESLSGKLALDVEGCLRLEEYLLILPPETHLREDPLRIADRALDKIAQIGDSIQVTGAECSG